MKKTKPLFSFGTRQALHANVEGYVEQEAHLEDRIQQLRQEQGIDEVYRFDLGQNCDGCAPAVADQLRELLREQDLRLFLKDYPGSTERALRERIAALHDIDPSWIVFSAGMEQMIGLVASALIDRDDRAAVCHPCFFLFENYTRRVGGTPIFLHLREDEHYDWTDQSLDELREGLSRLGLKLVWLANPNNPTGRALPEVLLPGILEEARKHQAVVVVDEAYGEYLDPPSGVRSASSLLRRHPNLVVMRTFSKAHGLANMRLGYGIVSDPCLRRAIQVHHHNYPVTQLAYDLAATSLDNLEYLEKTRQRTRRRMAQVMAGLAQLPECTAVPSDSSIFMLRHHRLGTEALLESLERRGVLVARIPGSSEVSRTYVRINLGQERANRRLLGALEELSPQRHLLPTHLSPESPVVSASL